MNLSLIHSPDESAFYWQKQGPVDWSVSQPFKTRTRALQAKIHGRLGWRRETEIRPGGKP